MFRFKKGVPEILYQLRFGILFALLAIIAISGLKLSDLKIDNSLEVWFVETDSSLASYNNFIQEFGNDEVIISVLCDSLPLSNSERLLHLTQITDSLKTIQGVNSVWSLSDIYVPGIFQLTSIGELVHSNTNKAVIDSAIQFIRNSYFEKQFLGNSSNSTAIYTWLDTIQDIDLERERIISEIEQTVLPFSQNGNIYHGGVGYIYNALNKATINESGVFTTLSIVFVLLLVIFLTRSWFWSLLSVSVLTLANIILFGTMTAFNRPVTMVTAALPLLLVIIGISNIMHLSKHINFVNSGSFFSSFRKVSIVLLFNALTTSAGFASLSTANMAVTKDYGLFAALGILIAFGIAAFSTILFARKPIKHSTSSKNSKLIAHYTEKIMLLSLRKNSIVLVLGGMIILIASLLICRVNIDTFTIKFLPKKHEVRTSSNAIEKEFGYYLPLEFVIEPDSSLSFNDLSTCMLKFQNSIENEEHIKSSISLFSILNDYGKYMYWANTADLGSVTNKGLVSKDGKKYRLTAFVKMLSSKDLYKLGTKISAIGNDVLKNKAIVTKSGYLPLYGRIVDNLLNDQIKSILIALSVILLLLLIILRSFKLLLLAIPSNILPVLLVLAFMGLFHIPLDMATITISAAVLGLVVDDSVHILVNLKNELKKGTSLETAYKEIAQKTGVAMVYTSFALIGGFAIMIFAGVTSIRYTGLLLSIAILAALFADLIFIPALSKVIFKKNSISS